MTNLAGLHDREGQAIAPPGTWVVDTVALSTGPIPTAYRPGLNWIARLNWGYGSTGTLPLPDQYGKFAQSAAGYVSGCSGCSRWIIGNEPNLSREWPNGQPIFPWHYAACYKLCRQAIHALPGHERDEVLVAAPGPWNAELRYTSNLDGDWIVYFSQVNELLGGDVDGFALHAYTHGYDPALVTSTAKMGAPFEDRYYEFRTYQDYIRAIPEPSWHLPVYITEANGNGPWQATGLMPAMLAEINGWNDTYTPKIQCLAFYRFPHYDDFYIEGREDVIAEYRAAVAKGYTSPPVKEADALPDKIFIPKVATGAPAATLPPRDIDQRLIDRGVHFEFVSPPAGTWYWRMTKAQWLDNAAQQVGPDHHILGRVLKQGVETAGVRLYVEWPSDDTRVFSKADDPNATYNYDYAMGPSLNEYRIRVDDGNPSDKVSGIGMGKDGNSKEHTSTWLNFEFVQAEPQAGQLAPTPPTQPAPTAPSPAGPLIWPVQGQITQYFGRHEIDYSQFSLPGHDGLDFGVREGTPVRAVAAGKVMWVDNDPAGFGLYVRIFHPAHGFHSFMGHLSKQLVTLGQMVKQGDTVALSGNTGNSSGPHLHYSCRVGSENAYYEMHDGYYNGATNPLAVHAIANKNDPNGGRP